MPQLGSSSHDWAGQIVKLVEKDTIDNDASVKSNSVNHSNIEGCESRVSWPINPVDRGFLEDEQECQERKDNECSKKHWNL